MSNGFLHFYRFFLSFFQIGADFRQTVRRLHAKRSLTVRSPRDRTPTSLPPSTTGRTAHLFQRHALGRFLGVVAGGGCHNAPGHDIGHGGFFPAADPPPRTAAQYPGPSAIRRACRLWRRRARTRCYTGTAPGPPTRSYPPGPTQTGPGVIKSCTFISKTPFRIL